MDYEKQANDFAQKHGIKLSILDKNYDYYFEDDKEMRWIFELKLSRNGENYTFKFGQSIARGETDPTMYDVLTCLTKYDPETFEDFCDCYGYDNDSRKAERIYNAVVEEFQNVEILFGDILDELSEIQ